MTKKLDPIAPGAILLEDFMTPLGVSQNRLARDTGLAVSRISEIVHGRRAITADTALRFAAFFGTSAEMWMALQAEYDLRRARAAHGREIHEAVQPLNAA